MKLSSQPYKRGFRPLKKSRPLSWVRGDKIKSLLKICVARQPGCPVPGIAGRDPALPAAAPPKVIKISM